jgi:replicative DNA helicase
MRKGEVYVLGANQGAGKSSIALQFALAAMRARKGTLYFSMEMLWRDLFQRLIAMEARVDLLEYEYLQRGEGDRSEETNRLLLSTSEIQRYPLLVSTKSRVTPQYIAKESLRLKKRQPIDFVVVDHMQLMGAAGKSRSDYEKFTEISRVMKETAVEMDVPVLLISQTSRANSARVGSLELEVSDLRGSGAIEEDAAAVFLLYPDKDDVVATQANKTFSTGPVKTWLKVGKNRYGHSGKHLPLAHNKRHTRFDEIEERT